MVSPEKADLRQTFIERDAETDLWSQETIEHIEKFGKLYLKELGLSQDELKDKLVLDIGSGPGRVIEAYCRLHRITDSVVSLDPKLYIGAEQVDFTQEKQLENKILPERKVIVGKIQRLPLRQNAFDIAIIRDLGFGGRELALGDEQLAKERVKKMYNWVLRVLNKNGTFHYFAIAKYKEGQNLNTLYSLHQEALEELKQQGKIVYRIKEAVDDRQDSISRNRVILQKIAI